MSQLSRVTASEAFQFPSPIVKPRTRSYRRLSVVAIAGDTVLNEDGLITPLDSLTSRLPSMPPTLFVKRSSADFVAHLDRLFTRRYPNWQWRAGTCERDICRPDGVRVAARVSVTIHYFGWKGGNYHRIIDPVVMYGRGLDDIWPGDKPPLYRLLEWAVAVRDFCDENSIDVRPTTGGISSQFLTDRRFYPDARRKVPSKINERVREALPGNHYILRAAPTPHRTLTAHYLDQHRAHHYHARTTPMPASDHLYAYGRFVDLADIVFDKPLDNFHGLYCLDLTPPVKQRPSHWVTKLDAAFVFTNELPHLLDDGYRVKGIRAAWGSFQRDTGLARYATWACQQLDRYGDKPWLKPLLLSTYGTLATRPRFGEAVFKQAKKGEHVTLPTGRHNLTGTLVQASKKLEPRIANVLHRGMIEAATRSESVGLGQWLYNQGHAVLSVYADAVIVRDNADLPLPLLPEPWRNKQTLNHLQFINQQAFISDGMTKLPGVSRELRAYRQHRKPGYAPRRIKYEAISGQPVITDRRI